MQTVVIRHKQRKAGVAKPTRRGVFEARSIRWQEADGSWSEQRGVPAIVRTSSRCQSRSDRRRMFHTAEVCGVKLVPVQFGETMAHGHAAVIAWLALCDGSDEAMEAMERFLECGLVTWEHCVMWEIPYGMTKLARGVDKVRAGRCGWVEMNNRRRELEALPEYKITDEEKAELHTLKRKLSMNDVDAE